MGNKTEIWQGTLALMILKTIESLGPLHGYGIARRIEQTSGDLLSLNYGTLYPALLKLEQEGSIVSEWGVSENNRKAKFYKLTRAGRRQLAKETREWDQTTAILARFLDRTEDPSVKQLRAWLLRLKGVFLKNARERDLAAEIESHLQMHIDDNLRAGMSPEQARRVAILKLGGVDSTKEAYRDRSTIPFLENLLQDLRFTVRQLRKNPGFTITAILMVTLGIGASVAIFGFTDAALIKPRAGTGDWEARLEPDQEPAWRNIRCHDEHPTRELQRQH
jgi:PadR family transcriptional regulator PadR